MIDDKKIEEAATVASISDTEKGRVREGYVINALADHENGFREGYIEGAKWAINEFLKNLWHPASEEPKKFKEILAEAKITESIKTYISFKRNDALFKNWDAYSSGANITRWLYVDDLFPKKGGEQ